MESFQACVALAFAYMLRSEEGHSPYPLDRARTVSCRLFVFSSRTLHHYPVLAAAHSPPTIWNWKPIEDARAGSWKKGVYARVLSLFICNHVVAPNRNGEAECAGGTWQRVRCSDMENEHPTATVARRKPMPNQVDNKQCYGLRRYPAEVHCSYPERKYYD